QVNLSLSNQPLANVLASVSAALASPTTSDLVAEVFVPGGRASGHSFLMGSADLELIDITGRRLGDWEVGSLGTGSHAMEVGGKQRLMPGIYLVRLTQAGQSLTSRVAVIE